jgi:Carboxymuconolactone decarboxylase family
MLVRAAVLTASVFIAGAVLAADANQSARCEYNETHAGQTVRFDRCATIARGQTAREPQYLYAPISVDHMGDFGGARGPDPHARDLTNIAVSASLGDRDAMEIASSRLRQFGVTREQIQDAIERTRLHGDPAGESVHGQSRVGVDANSVWVISY